MARPDKKQLSTDDIYAELGMDVNNKHTKELILGDQAQLMALTREREERRLAKAQEREAEKAAAEENVKKKDDLGPLKFRKGPMGSLICGKPPEPQNVPIAVPSSSPSPQERASMNATAVSVAATRPKARGGGAGAAEEHAVKLAAGLDGEPGQWRRVTAERYVDCYLNGGKYEPLAQSLMEEVDRQRKREGGYRNVSMYESGFVGKVRSPLGKLGGRFRGHLEPMSVKQIAFYRKQGKRRPLQLADAQHQPQ